MHMNNEPASGKWMRVRFCHSGVISLKLPDVDTEKYP